MEHSGALFLRLHMSQARWARRFLAGSSSSEDILYHSSIQQLDEVEEQLTGIRIFGAYKGRQGTENRVQVGGERKRGGGCAVRGDASRRMWHQ
jgi:hypothetical protein